MYEEEAGYNQCFKRMFVDKSLHDYRSASSLPFSDMETCLKLFVGIRHGFAVVMHR